MVKTRFIKKLILITLLIQPIATHAYISYSAKNDHIYSYPQADNINPTQYQDLFRQLCERAVNYPFNGDLTILSKSIINYLNTLNTPTALRLLADIGGKEFNSKHLIFFYFGIIFSHGNINTNFANNFVKELRSNCKKLTQSEFDEFIPTLRQVGTIVIMCWNSGIFGPKLQKQIDLYMEEQNIGPSKGYYLFFKT